MTNENFLELDSRLNTTNKQNILEELCKEESFKQKLYDFIGSTEVVVLVELMNEGYTFEFLNTEMRARQ